MALVADTNPTTLAKLNVRVGFWQDIGAKMPPSEFRVEFWHDIGAKIPNPTIRIQGGILALFADTIPTVRIYILHYIALHYRRQPWLPWVDTVVH